MLWICTKDGILVPCRKLFPRNAILSITSKARAYRKYKKARKSTSDSYSAKEEVCHAKSSFHVKLEKDFTILRLSRL